MREKYAILSTAMKAPVRLFALGFKSLPSGLPLVGDLRASTENCEIDKECMVTKKEKKMIKRC